MKMKWICNTQDPQDKDHAHTWYDANNMAWRLPYNDLRIVQQNRWLLEGRLIGEPQVPPDSPVTLEDLKRLRLVGVYEEEA